MVKIADCFYIDVNKPFKISFDYGGVEGINFYGSVLVNGYGLAVHRIRICIPCKEVHENILEMDELSITRFMNKKIEEYFTYYPKNILSLQEYIEAVLSPSKEVLSYYLKADGENSFKIDWTSIYGVKESLCFYGSKNKSNELTWINDTLFKVKYVDVKDDFKGFFNWFEGSVYEKDLLEFLKKDIKEIVEGNRGVVKDIMIKAYNNYFDIR